MSFRSLLSLRPITSHLEASTPMGTVAPEALSRWTPSIYTNRNLCLVTEHAEIVRNRDSRLKTYGDDPLASVRGSDNTLSSSVGTTENLDGVTLDNRDGADLKKHKDLKPFPSQYPCLFSLVWFRALCKLTPCSALRLFERGAAMRTRRSSEAAPKWALRASRRERDTTDPSRSIGREL